MCKKKNGMLQIEINQNKNEIRSWKVLEVLKDKHQIFYFFKKGKNDYIVKITIWW